MAGFLKANQAGALGLSPGDKADLVTIQSPDGAKFTVARKVAPQFSSFLTDLHGTGYALNPKTSGGYNDRNIAGRAIKSQHAFGNAIDLNWDVNARRAGNRGNLPANVSDIAAKHGIAWGGTWKNPDPMHFEVSTLTPGAPASSYMANNAATQATNGAPMATPIGGPPIAGGPVPLNPPSPRRSKLSEALLAQSMGAKVTGWGDALRALSGMYVGTHMGDKADKEQGEYRSKLAEALSGASNENLPATLLGSGDDDLMKQGVAMKIAQGKPQQPQIGRFKTDVDGNVFDSASGQIVVQGKGRSNAPAGYRATPEGDLTFIPGGPADPALKPKGRDKYTELQSKAANFGNMMTEADKALLAMAPKGADGNPDATKIENPKNFLGAVRDGIMPFEALRNKSTPNETQAYNQIAKQWIRAKLRKESGAAIGDDEMEQEFRTYFPQYGDGPDVLKQKALAREQATKGMIAESGGAYGQLFSQQPPTDAGPAPATPAPQPAAPQAPKAPPAPAVEMLKANPSPQTRQQFDQIFGPGAADRVLGAVAPTYAPTPEELQSTYSLAQ
jgi:hypothetical protein